MPFLDEMDERLGLVDAEVGDRGLELQAAYNAGTPFPHIAIDDFLPPSILDRCLKEFPAKVGELDTLYDRDQERLKVNFNPDYMSPFLRTLFYSLNSRPFIKVIENITGIKRLIPDPYYLGAGLHEISQGGHLSVHADFNRHKPMNLERRINLLIYLNKDWRAEYGGQLELWNQDMSQKVQDIVPIFNRCVIFNTTSNSLHGNPQVVNHPAGVSRKSIAMYYYTATWDISKRQHTTQFKTRADSNDRVDWKVRGRELVFDLVPPVLLRQFLKKTGD